MTTKESLKPLDHRPSADPANGAAVSAAKHAPASATVVGVLMAERRRRSGR
jgi:hypothetical protein